ncbi:TetR family transcriptional regulator [Isoptericola sp. NPDC056573]|uniref:TetR family transcriptional regulator n=1 Tax=Isoptericola sp. NPDC056573 TaxID=3345868 RepID=UPI00368A1775
MAERKRLAVREELGVVALRLLAADGFEGTTIDQIARAAGCSRRTFFRYFNSKEDVVIEVLSDLCDLILDALRARPANESPLTALRGALEAAVPFVIVDPGKFAALARLISASPALQGRHLRLQYDLEVALSAELAARQGVAQDNMALRLTAGAALRIFDLVMSHWTDSDGHADLTDLFDDAFALLATPGLHAG